MASKDDVSNTDVKWYLKCENCGEVFDDMYESIAHGGENMDGDECWVWDDAHGDFTARPLMSIVTEEEAF